MLARGFLPAGRTPELRALCHILLAHLALARGRNADARGELLEAQAQDRAWGLELRALFAALPFGGATEEEIRQVREELEAWDGTASPSSFLPFALHDDLHPAIRLWLLGLLDLRLGDSPSALERAARLSSLPDDEWGLVRGMEGEIRAAVAGREGKPAEALALLDASRPRPWFQLTVASPFFTLAGRRWLQAELLEAAGRKEEAAGWYASMAERAPYEVVYAGEAARRVKSVKGELKSVKGER